MRAWGGRINKHEGYKLYGKLILCNSLINIIRKKLKDNFTAYFNNAALMNHALSNNIREAADVHKTI